MIVLVAACLAPPLFAADDESPDKTSRAVVERVEPHYPELARRNHMAGTVKLKVVIAPDGRPKNVEVVGGNPVFLDSATSSVRRWKWSAADRESTQVVEIRFQSGS